jgi:ABC-2 type transport system ATP-binding protein
MSAIVCSGVTKAVSGHPILRGVDLRVSSGDVYCLFGTNGAGKTTLLRILMGFVAADAGAVEILNVPLPSGAAEVRSRVAYVPETAELFPTLSATGHAKLFDEILGRAADERSYRAVLKDFGFPMEAADRPANRYSKGMRQKVILMLGRIKDAQVFLLDEPFSGLDAPSAHTLERNLLALKDAGKAVLITSHDSLSAARVATSAGLLIDGRIGAEMTVRERSGEVLTDWLWTNLSAAGIR